MGPYRIRRTSPAHPTFHLEDLDGTPLPHTVPGHRLKLFRQRTVQDIAEQDRGRMKLWDLENWDNTSISVNATAGPVSDGEDKDLEARTRSQVKEREARNEPRLISQPSVQPRVVITKTLSEEERKAYRMDFVPSSESDSTSDVDTADE